MSAFVHTTRFTRGKLPHWEVADGRYFITVRCADSLPHTIVDRLREIHESLRQIEPQSDQFVALQRRYFQTMGKHLDAGVGACRLRDPRAAQIVMAELDGLIEWDIAVPHFSIMPNHWHAMLAPHKECGHTLSEIIRRVKGRTSRAINSVFETHGAFWQREWFDRWMRNDAEYDRCVAYIQNNPVKAGLARTLGEHRWTR
jgi:REP element-mobilizing transposase RayT